MDFWTMRSQGSSGQAGAAANAATQSGSTTLFGRRATSMLPEQPGDQYADMQSAMQRHVSDYMAEALHTIDEKVDAHTAKIDELWNMVNKLAEEVFFQQTKQEAAHKAIDRLHKLNEAGPARVAEAALDASAKMQKRLSHAGAGGAGQINKVKSLFKKDRGKGKELPPPAMDATLSVGGMSASLPGEASSRPPLSMRPNTAKAVHPTAHSPGKDDVAETQESSVLGEFDPEGIDRGRELHMLVSTESRDILQADSGQVLSQIASDTDALVGLGSKVNGRTASEHSAATSSAQLDGPVYILSVKQMSGEAQLQHAVQKLLTVLNPGVRDTSKHNLVLLVRKARVANVLASEDAQGRGIPDGVTITFSPLRPDLKREFSTSAEVDFTDEMTLNGDLTKVQALLGTLIEKGGIAPLKSTSQDAPQVRNHVHQHRPQEGVLYNNNENMLDSLERAARQQELQRERDDVKLQMEQFGLTEECLKDTEEEAIARAKRIGRNTCKGRILIFITSRYFQFASFLCIMANLFVMWFEVDSEKDSPVQRRWRNIQYALTCCFIVEACLNLIAFPEICRFKEMIFDIAVVFLAFVMETFGVLVPKNNTNSTWLLLLRLVRFFRFVRMIRNRGGARTVRVLTAALLGSVLNLIWITLFLMMIFYCGAIIFRSLLRDIQGTMTVMNIRDEYFSTVPATMLTLIETFLDSFDYSTRITRPLLDYSASQTMAYMWLGYHLLVRLVIVNLIAGLYIEQLTRSAAASDERAAKETFAANDVTYKRIEQVFDIIDQQREGAITHNEFKIAWTLKDDVEKLLQISKPPFNGDHLSFFHFMDVQGVGELSFSDFAYGVIAHRCGSTSIDKMIFDHASKSLLRQSAATKKSLIIAQKVVEDSNEKVNDIDKMIRALKNTYLAKAYDIKENVRKFTDNVSSIREGLGLEPNAPGGEKRGLVNVHNVREARNIQDLMQDLKQEIAKVNDAAQAQATSLETSKMLKTMREKADEEINRGVNILQQHQAVAISAAKNATRAASAMALMRSKEFGQDLPAAPPATLTAPPMSALRESQTTNGTSDTRTGADDKKKLR